MGEQIEKQVNKCLRDLNVLHDVILKNYENWDVDWCLLQVENAQTALLNLIENGDR